MKNSDSFTHINERGEANMVDIGGKTSSERSAIARCFVVMQPKTLKMIEKAEHKKGDVISIARVAGIQAAKKCSELIPLCHPIMLSKVEIDIQLDKASNRVAILALCKLTGKTGVEMEALTACNIAALTIYDMCKAVDKHMIIENTQVISKTGGQSGDWTIDE